MEILVIGTENSGKSLLTHNIKDWIQHKSLSKYAILDNVTGPTIGVDITDLQLPNAHIMSNLHNVPLMSFKIRELGSAISSKWHTYYEDADGLIFTIDCADMSTWSNSIVLLHECLHYFTSSCSSDGDALLSVYTSTSRDCPTNGQLLKSSSTQQGLNASNKQVSASSSKGSIIKRKPLLIVFTKTDITDSLSLHVLQDMIRLEEILDKSQSNRDLTFPIIEVIFGSSFDEKLIQSIVKWMQDTLSASSKSIS